MKLLRIVPLFIVLALLLGVGVVTAQEPTTVTMWVHEHPPAVPVWQDLVATFMADNPDITVNLEVIPVADFDTRVATAMASGTGPDLLNQWTGAIGQFYSAGALAPLNAEAAGFENQDAVIASYEGGSNILSGITFNDQLYGLPTEVSIYSCYANDDLWAAAGLDPATDFPTTWEGLKDVAEQLTVRDANGVITQRGFDFNWGNSIFMWLQFDPMVRQLGGTLVDPTTYEVAIDTPEVAQVMEYWNNWANEWNLGGPQYTGSRDAFLAGEQAIECSFGNWGIPQMEDAGVNWSLHKAPQWENAVNDNYLDTYAYFLMVNSLSAEPVQAAAWKLAGYLTSFPERFYTEAGLFQPKAEFVASDAFQSDPVMPVFFEQMATSFYPPAIVGFNEVADALARGRDRVVTGGEEVAPVLTDTQAEVVQALERARASAGQ